MEKFKIYFKSGKPRIIEVEELLIDNPFILLIGKNNKVDEMYNSDNIIAIKREV